MKKDQVIKGAIKLIEQIADEKGVEVINSGTGHGFYNSFWKDWLKDDIGIPAVRAKCDGFCIELRPFWDAPEIDVRIYGEKGEDLLVLNYWDGVQNEETGKIEHTGDFYVYEIRVDTHGDYMKCIQYIYWMILEIERFVKMEERVQN